ncbi:Glutathione hydrolase 1 proenzyme [Nymphon striatum]|nr:Glutathione hydrolase 1 proenzyme [Nymphon striatum]
MDRTRLINSSKSDEFGDSYGSIESYSTSQNYTDESRKPIRITNNHSQCTTLYTYTVLLLTVCAIITGEFVFIPIALKKLEMVKNCETKDLGIFPLTAVASDDYRCSETARKILRRNGSAVDAAIGAMLCLGVVVPQSTGLGRGLSVGIPGQVLGMWEAHQKFGKLPWSSLFKDSIKLSRDGAKVSPIFADYLMTYKKFIVAHTGLRNLFWNFKTNDVYKEGDVVKNVKLADTLERISLGGADEFYRKETAKILVNDIQNAGGIIKKSDLENYKVDWTTPITTKIKGMELFSVPPPSSSSYVFFLLNVMESYNFTPKDFKSTYSSTFDAEHYRAKHKAKIHHGTSHLSILAPDGSAVSVTTSLNYNFGSKLVSRTTGIILNNQMRDFSGIGDKDSLELPESPSNYISPGKRPMSSISPIIMVDPKTENVTAVVGSSGGPAIPTTIAQVMLLKLFLGKTTQEAVREPRIHHQLFPNNIGYEKNFPEAIIDGLRQKGHTLKINSLPITSASNVIFHTEKCITTSSDPRKGGLRASVGF